MHARTRNSPKSTQLFISITVPVLGYYVRVRPGIILKIDMLVDMYTDNLSFKFHEDPFIGSREIAETKLSMHISHF